MVVVVVVVLVDAGVDDEPAAVLAVDVIVPLPFSWGMPKAQVSSKASGSASSSMVIRWTELELQRKLARSTGKRREKRAKLLLFAIVTSKEQYSTFLHSTSFKKCGQDAGDHRARTILHSSQRHLELTALYANLSEQSRRMRSTIGNIYPLHYLHEL